MKLKLLYMDYIRLAVPAGGQICLCAMEAAQFALEHDAKVVFKHNGTDYTADPNEIVKLVLENNNRSTPPAPICSE